MEISLCTSVGEFLHITENFRSTLPYETNIISSVAESVLDESRTYDAYFWWVIRDTSQKVIGLAMRTAPHGLLLSPMSDSSVAALAIEVAKHDDQLTGVGGSRDLVRKFLQAYRDNGSIGSQREIESTGGELVYVLKDLILPSTPGEMRTATSEEHKLLREWFLAFAEEAGIYMHDLHVAIEDGLHRASLRWWIVDGEIVSMAGHAPLVQIPDGAIARIGPVYTPPTQRRRGYAGALTAALSKELRDGGAKLMLYTDASNPTSNSVYQKIGYVKLAENERISFVKQA